MTRFLILLAGLALALASVVAFQPSASANHLSSYDVCAINLPHPGPDYVIEHYWVHPDTDRCIGAHGTGVNRTLHYYVVCEPGYPYGWHWKPGVAAWLDAQCP